MRIDTKSETWQAVEANVTKRIESLAKQLETDQPETTTAAIRAEIRASRHLLNLPAIVNAETFTYETPND